MANIVTPETAKVVRDLYVLHIIPLDIGTDAICFRSDLVELLAREFYKRTRIRVPGMLLAAWIENERKAGRWYTLRDRGIGFADLDDIATA